MKSLLFCVSLLVATCVPPMAMAAARHTGDGASAAPSAVLAAPRGRPYPVDPQHLQESAARIEALTQARLGISVNAIAALVSTRGALYTSEYTLRAGELGYGLKELQRAGYVTIRAESEDRPPIVGGREKIVIVPTEKGQAVATAFTPSGPFEQPPRARPNSIRPPGPNHSVRAFGGTLVGTDMGEFGGDVTFKPADGSSYRIMDLNSQGIFKMPFGVIALTGLTHLSGNQGAVYLVARGPDGRIEATKTATLPGKPCAVVRTDRALLMRVYAGYRDTADGRSIAVFECLSLVSRARLVKMACPVEPEALSCGT